jgi:hypothetical protein
MARRRPLEVKQELLEAFRHNGLVNEYLVTVLPDGIWRLPPPGGRGRSLAAIVAHMHSSRRRIFRAYSKGHCRHGRSATHLGLETLPPA